METNYITKRLKLIWPLFALLMLVSFSVDAQEKGQTLKLTIECDGRVLVNDAVSGDNIKTILGPVQNSEVPVSSNQQIHFVTENDDNYDDVPEQPNLCLEVLRWENGAGTVLGTDGNLLSSTVGPSPDPVGIVMTGDNLDITVFFGLKAEGPGEIVLDDDVENDGIETIGNTPVIVDVTTIFPVGIESPCYEDWVLDVNFTVEDAADLHGEILEIGVSEDGIEWDYLPVVDGTISSDFLLSDVIGAPNLGLLEDLMEGSLDWKFVIHGNPDLPEPTSAETFNFNMEMFTYHITDQCPTSLAENDFDITYRPVSYEITENVGCGITAVCFDVDVDFPPVKNIGDRGDFETSWSGGDVPFSDYGFNILNNMWISGPFASGQLIDVTFDGVSFEWEIPGQITLDGFYLSQIFHNSVSKWKDYGLPLMEFDGVVGTDELSMSICLDELSFGEEGTTFGLTAAAQLELYDFDGDDFVLTDIPEFIYAEDDATLVTTPYVEVTYEKDGGTGYAAKQYDKVCTQTNNHAGIYNLKAQVAVFPENEEIADGYWKVKDIPQGASVSYDDKHDPNTIARVSSFGTYTFYWYVPGYPAYDEADHDGECDDADGMYNCWSCMNENYIKVAFYPEVEATLTPPTQEVCSLATQFHVDKQVIWGGHSTNMEIGCGPEYGDNPTTYTVGDSWLVEKWDEALGEWVTKDWYEYIDGTPETVGGKTLTFSASHVDNDEGYGRYKITYAALMCGRADFDRSLTLFYPDIPAWIGDCELYDGKEIGCERVCHYIAEPIYIEFFWKPYAEILEQEIDVCDLLPNANADGPWQEIKANNPLNLENNTWANGKGQWIIDGNVDDLVFHDDYADLTNPHIKFNVVEGTSGSFTFHWEVENDAPGIPCDSPVASEPVEMRFPEEPVAVVNNNDMIHCFTQVKWEPFMDITAGADAYFNPLFTGAADEAGKLRIFENWVTNYEGNVVQLDAETYPEAATGQWSYTFEPYADYDYGYFNDTGLDEVYFVLPAEEGVTPDPRVFDTWTLAGAANAEDAIAVFIVPGKYELTWTIEKDCDFEDSDSFDVEFLPSPKPLKLLEVTDQGEVVPPRPVCLDEEVHYILRRTDGQEPTVDPEKRDVFWHIPDNFEVLEQGGGAGTDQYWVKGVWTDDVEGAHFEVEEVRYTLHGCKTVNTFDPIEYKPYIESVEIVGNEIVPVGIVQTYEAVVELLGDYEDATVEFEWTITGGEILSGEGTSEIEVMWDEDFEDDLTLHVVAHGLDFCNEEEDEITVEIEEGKIVGQLRYWNPEETAMPSPFKTIIDDKPIPDFFYVELWTADEDGNPVEMITRTHARDREEPRYDAYFEFNDIDLNLDYVLYVYDGSYDIEGGLEDGELGFSWTWNNWGGVTIRDAFAINRMSVGTEISEDPYNWTWVGPVEDDYGFFAHALADVNSDGDITSSDAFWVVQRILGREATYGDFSPNFKVAGRLVETLDDKTWDVPFSTENDEDIVFTKLFDDVLYQGTSLAADHGFVSQVIPFNGEAARDIVIYYGAGGDVSASYRKIESGYKAEPSDVDLAYTGIIEAQKGDVIDIPVRISDATSDIGGMLVGLTYDNSLIEVIDVDAEMHNIVNDEGWLRVSEIDIDGMSFGDNQKLFTVTARIIGDIADETELFEIEDVTEIIDREMNGLDITLNSDLVTTSPVSVIDTEVTDLSISNFPNPFNQSTTIEYALPETGKVTLVVYNQVGQVVNTLVSENQNAGHQSVEVTSSDLGHGEGMFIYRITVEGQNQTYTATGNMILMK